MAFNHTGEYLVVGSDTETVHLFRCVAPKTPGGKAPTPVNRTWSGGSGLSGGADDGDTEDMDRIVEGKRRNGSMGQKIRKGSQSLTKQFATSLAPLLPTSVTEIWEPSRDFAHIKIPQKTSGTLISSKDVNGRLQYRSSGLFSGNVEGGTKYICSDF
jgi:autophagy-related protein 18